MLPSVTLTIVVSRKVRNSTASTVVSAAPPGPAVRPVAAAARTVEIIGSAQLGRVVAGTSLQTAGNGPSTASNSQNVWPATFHLPPSFTA